MDHFTDGSDNNMTRAVVTMESGGEVCVTCSFSSEDLQGCIAVFYLMEDVPLFVQSIPRQYSQPLAQVCFTIFRMGKYSVAIFERTSGQFGERPVLTTEIQGATDGTLLFQMLTKNVFLNLPSFYSNRTQR